MCVEKKEQTNRQKKTKNRKPVGDKAIELNYVAPKVRDSTHAWANALRALIIIGKTLKS